MEKQYYIKMRNGTEVPVTEDIYRAYKRPAWKEHKQRPIRAEFERSLDRLEEDDVPIYSKEAAFEGIVVDRLLLETLLSSLTTEERFIIDEIYFKGKTERQFAKETNKSNVAINKRHRKILEKLKNYKKIN